MREGNYSLQSRRPPFLLLLLLLLHLLLLPHHTHSEATAPARSQGRPELTRPPFVTSALVVATCYGELKAVVITYSVICNLLVPDSASSDWNRSEKSSIWCERRDVSATSGARSLTWISVQGAAETERVGRHWGELKVNIKEGERRTAAGGLKTLMDAAACEVIGYVWTYFKKARFWSDSQPDVCVLHISARQTRHRLNFITVFMPC